MKPARFFCGAALLAAVCLIPSSASAYWPLYGAGFGGGGFGGAGFYGPWYGSLHSAAYSPPPPYYSIHPPVYYSGNIVRRSYGWSPYAYGPYAPPSQATMPAAAEAAYEPAPQPLLVINPYVKDDAALPAPRGK